jgi:putative membrane protein insertion efficiency factor
MKRQHSLAAGLGLFLLWLYRHCISPWKPACCRFTPSCSTYACDALRHYGFCRGGWMALRRILRCHPFYRGPLYDPVEKPHQAPEKMDSTT